MYTISWRVNYTQLPPEIITVSIFFNSELLLYKIWYYPRRSSFPILIFMNDIDTVYKNGKLLLFADDLKMYNIIYDIRY